MWACRNPCGQFPESFMTMYEVVLKRLWIPVIFKLSLLDTGYCDRIWSSCIFCPLPNVKETKSKLAYLHGQCQPLNSRQADCQSKNYWKKRNSCQEWEMVSQRLCYSSEGLTALQIALSVSCRVRNWLRAQSIWWDTKGKIFIRAQLSELGKYITQTAE